MDGYESVWHERTGNMIFRIRFEDDALIKVGFKEFTVTRQSAGWTGDFSNPPCVCR